MFGRATTTLGIGPHSSYSYCDFVRTLHRRKALFGVIGLFKFKFKFTILYILFLETLIVLSLSAMHSCTTAPIAEVGVAN